MTCGTKRRRGNGGTGVRNGSRMSRMLEGLESRVMMNGAMFSASGTTIVEGNSREMLTVTLTSNVASVQTVHWSTADGTAVKGKNYASKSGSKKVGGHQTFTVKIPILANPVYQPSTRFYLDLGTNAGSVQRVPLIIQDPHVPPTVTVQDVTMGMGTSKQKKSGSRTVSIPVTLSNASLLPVLIRYTTVNGTALAGADYKRTSGTLRIAPGRTTGAITVTVLPYTAGEADKVFGVQLLSVTNGALKPVVSGGAEYARVQLKNMLGSGLVRPTVTVSDATVIAGGSETFNVTLSRATPLTVSFRYRTVPGTATTSAYVPMDGVLRIPAGSRTGTITIPTQHSVGTVETHFSLMLSAPANAVLGRTRADATITPAETITPELPTVGVTDADARNLGTGNSTLSFQVTLASASNSPVTVNYATTDGTAAAGTDYVATNGVLTFAPGETSKTVDVTVIGNGLVSPSKTMTLTLSAASGAILSKMVGVGTISNNNVPGVSIGSASIEAIDGYPYAQTLSFPVTLSSAATFPVSVNYATENLVGAGNGEFGRPLPYVRANGTLTFAPGETSKTISVSVTGSSSYSNFTFGVALSDAANATLSTATGIGTIAYAGTDLSDNTQQPYYGELAAMGSIDWPAASFTTGSDSQSLKSITVPLQLESPGSVSLMIYSDNSGVPGTHLATLTSPASFSTTSHEMTTFSATGINLDPNTTYWVLLQSTGTVGVAAAENTTGSGLGYTGTTLEWNGSWTTPFSGQHPMQMEVITTDVGPGISVAPVSVSEVSGNITTQTANFTVTLSAYSPLPVTVHYATSDGNAVAGTDYTATSGDLTFAPGENSKTISVTVTGDSVSPTETLNLTLSNATNASITTGTAVGTIQFMSSAVLSDNYAGTDAGFDNTSWLAADFTTGSAAAALQDVTLALSSTNGVDVAIYSDNAGQPGSLVGTLTHSTGNTFTSDNLPLDPNTTYWVVAQNAEWTYAMNGSSTGAGYLGDFAESADGSVWSINPSGGRTLKMQVNAFVAGAPSLSIAPASVSEIQGNPASQTMTFTVTLDNPAPFPVSVDYATADGTALAGTDYTAANGTLTFAPGETSKTISVTITGITASSDESLSLNLSNATNASITAGTANGTITYGGIDLSDNLGNPANGINSVLSDNWLAASFVTSSSSVLLSSITLPIYQRSAGDIAVVIYTDNGGLPGTAVETLASPGNYSTTVAANARFTSSGIALDPNATYWVVLQPVSGNLGVATTFTSGGTGAGFTGSDVSSNDSGISWSGGPWLKMQVAVVPVVDLSDNLSESNGGWEGIGNTQWLAASFTTGSSSVNLLSVTLPAHEYSAGTLSAMIYSDNSGSPASLVGNLTLSSGAPDTSGLADVTFTAAGITLNANSTYWVVLATSDGTFGWGITGSSSGTGSGFTGIGKLSHDLGSSWSPDLTFQMQVLVFP
ncbi:MAG: choice-of-anchor R domain-containing protein [Phycisphaerae bacterium]